MKISLSEHFTYGKLLKFTLPSVIMMIFTSIYGVVDGFFVSNFTGKTAFTAVNFIYPFLMILGAVGFMFGTGGSALIAKTMGEGEEGRAQEIFSMLVYFSFACGVVIALIGFVLIRPVAEALGAEGEMLRYCVLYGRIILAALPYFMLQYEFQSFFVVAEKPNLGLFVTVLAGCTNIVLDALLVAVFPFGLTGAAIATAASQVVGGLVPLLYFVLKNNSRLKLVKAGFDSRSLFKACVNGSSELMSNISMSIVSMLYNAQLIACAGNDGVAAYGVLMYVNMIFLAVFIGYAVGSSPVVSYHYGAGNHDELKGLLKKSVVIIGIFSAAMLVMGEILAKPLSELFVGYDESLMEMTLRGFLIYSFSFLFAGFAIYGSAFFTALNNGLVSALISFIRTLVFQVAAVLLLPMVWGIDGIWASIVIAELLATVTTAVFVIKLRKEYNY